MAHPPPVRTSAEIRSLPLLSDRAFERIPHDIISCVTARSMVLSAILTSGPVMNLALGAEGPQ